MNTADWKGDTARGARYFAEQNARRWDREQKQRLKLRGETMAKGSGLQKEMKCSEELQTVVKEKKISRGQMMKAVWKYIKKHNLQDKEDKRTINPAGSKLEAVLGKKPINMFKMTAKLSEHLS